MAIALAWAIVETARSPRLAPLAITLTVAGAIAAFNGLKATYLATNFPLNLSEPFAQIIAGYRPGDTVVTAGLVAQRGEANYYVRQLRLAHRGVTELRVIEDRTLMPATGMRLWVVTDTVWVPVIAQALAKARWQTVYRSVFVPSTELVLASR